jgi:hypothetical protein
MANDDTATRPLERKALDDPYVQLWLDKQVRDRTDEYLKRLRTGAGLMVGFAAAVLAWFGYQQNDVIRDLRAQVQTATGQAQKAADTVANAQTLLDDASRLSASTAQQVTSTTSLMQGNLAQAATSVGSLSSTLSNLTDQQNSIATAQANLERQAKTFEGQQNTITAAFEDQRAVIDESARKAQDSMTKAQDSMTTAEERRREVDKVAGGLQGLQSTYADILERRQVEYAFLRARDSRVIDLYSLTSDGGAPRVRRSQVMFTVAEIKDRINVVVSVLDGGDGRPGAERTYSQLRSTQTPIRIDGTAFVFRVEFIYHAKLAFDFAVVKVQAAG